MAVKYLFVSLTHTRYIVASPCLFSDLTLLHTTNGPRGTPEPESLFRFLLKNLGLRKLCVCVYVNMPKFGMYVHEFLKLKTKFNKNLVLGIGTIKLVFPEIGDAPYYVGS